MVFQYWPPSRLRLGIKHWMVHPMKKEQLKKQLRAVQKYWQSWWRHLWNLGRVAARATEVGIRLSPLLLLTPAAYMAGPSSSITDLAWRYLISATQGIGPVAVKFAQWMATRRDVFPPTLCDRLGVLHDRGYPHSWSHTTKILEEAFGDYETKGLHIDQDDVIGCGSAAQVYRGTLTTKNENGEQRREVAVKVLHPNFQQQVNRDLKLIEIVAEALHSLPSDMIRMMNLPRATDTFGSTLCLQADLTNEANNLSAFRSNFYDKNRLKQEESSICFPQPVEGWSSSKVIVEDYVQDAIPIAVFLRDSSPEGLEIRHELAGPLLRAFLKMIHGDLHPGNVLVKTTTTKEDKWSSWWWWWRPSESATMVETTKRSIVFLDAGIANSLSPNDQRNLRDLFRAVIFNNGEKAGRLMVERAKYERCSQVPGGVDAFAKGVQEIVSEFHDRRREGLTLGAVRIGGLLARVLDLCRVHGVEIDPAMSSVVISTLVLEGLGRSLSPELNLLDFARPFVLGRGTV
eukprot:scaffold812_cov124-Cylindrotheca_fusiformis.AAC.4